MVGLERAKTLLNPKRSITGRVATVENWDLISHYRMFVAHLETPFIKSFKKLYSLILDSKAIIQSILKKKNIVLFSNINITVHLICIACGKPVITIKKKHIVRKQHSLSKMIIAENGPLLCHVDEILTRATSQYWRVGNSDGK